MKYPELKEPCKSAIEKGICTGCNALELVWFRGRKDCEYTKLPTAEQSIARGKQILGIQEKIKL